jgi:hypothetical protein
MRIKHNVEVPNKVRYVKGLKILLTHGLLYEDIYKFHNSSLSIFWKL